MGSFAARLHLPGQTRLPLTVEVDVADERLTLTSGDRRVAEWSLEDLDIVSQSDGFHIRVDGEEMILKVSDEPRFAVALGLTDAARGVQKINGSPGRFPVLDSTVLMELRYDDLRARILEVAEMLVSNEVEPSAVLARWLRLLKEMNRLHGQGSMTTQQFYELNTQLLDLMPEPTSSSAAPANT